MQNTSCIKCFQPLNGNNVCPHCGCDNTAYQPKASYLPAGTVLQGRYTVGLVLGEGGFGITYAGFDTQLERRVAIKEYFPAGCVSRDAEKSLQVTCSEAEDMRSLFEIGKQKALQEARSLARLDDIGDIVRVLDFFPENRTAYIIMEYVEGKTLRRYVKELGGTIGFDQLIDMLMQVMRALKDVHTRGFVHRDISPDNIMVTPRGQMKLLDFGAVKQLTDESGEYTQNVIVKRGFSPLELYSTADLIGPWSDVYSMCATIFFLVCGKKPQEPIERMKYDTAPDMLRDKVNPQYSAVMLKGLAVQEDQRYRNMGELIDALESAKAAGGFFTPPIADDATMRAVNRNGGARTPVQPFVPPVRNPPQPGPNAYADRNIYRSPPPEPPAEEPGGIDKKNLWIIIGLCVAAVTLAAVLIIALSGKLGNGGKDDKTTTASQEEEITEESGTAEKVTEAASGSETAPSATLPSTAAVSTGTTSATTIPVVTQPSTTVTYTTISTTSPTAVYIPPTASTPTASQTTTTTRPTERSTPAITERRAPSSKNEIISFYADAVNDIKNNGSASYTKKEFQTISNFNITGNSMVDGVIKNIADRYFKDETNAELQVGEKGRESSKSKMLGWSLTDNSKVVSASLDQVGGNYKITLVMADEDTPHKGSSHLAAVGSVLLWEDIENELNGISQLKEWEGNVSIVYTDYTITATVTPEGKLVSLRHHTDVEIRVAHAKILIVTLNDKALDMENTVVFSDFAY